MIRYEEIVKARTKLEKSQRCLKCLKNTVNQAATKEISVNFENFKVKNRVPDSLTL